MSIVNTLSLESNRQIKINFNGGDLSSDAGLLLIKEFEANLALTDFSVIHLRPTILHYSDITLIRQIFFR